MDIDAFPDGCLGQAQIKRLLSDAELRLRGSGSDDIAVTSSARSKTVDRNLPISFPRLNPGEIVLPYINANGEIARVDAHRLVNERERKLSGEPRLVEDSVLALEKLKKEKKATASSDWFNLPRTNLTSELKRDLQLLKMRSVLDPKRHYKKENNKAQTAEFSQVGTIIEGPTEFFSSRLQKKDRKQTLVDEVLAGKQSTRRFRSNYNDVQLGKTSGKKAYYKKLMEQRSSGHNRR